jgi:hypothetical protein
MRRLAPLLVLAVAVAGCGSKVAPRPIERATTSSATVTDRPGDAVDADGNPRRGRPDVDIVGVTIERNPDRVLYTLTMGAEPRGRIEFEIFAQSPEVGGYDVVKVTRDKGRRVSGYVAFENSVAKQMLSAPSSLSANEATLGIAVPIDPIFGATPYQWRITAKTASGAAISDYVPSPTGVKTFPAK